MNDTQRGLWMGPIGEMQDLVVSALQGLGMPCDVARQPHDVGDGQRHDVVLLDMRSYLHFDTALSQLWQRAGQACVIGIVEPREPVDRVLALEMGADAIVVPPFGAREIAARVGAVLRGSPPAARAHARERARAGGWPEAQGRLDGQARTLSLPGQAAVTLADSEARLLQLLASRPHQVMSRAEVMVRIGLSGQGRHIEMVEGVVSRLRRRLRELGVLESPIRTVRGQGYAWTPSALSLEVVGRAVEVSDD